MYCCNIIDGDRMSKKYQTGIQKAVLQVIENSKQLNLPYITKQQITHEVSQVIDLEDPKADSTNQIGQALYQLQRKSKYRRPRIKKYKDKDGTILGWTTINDKGYYNAYQLPRNGNATEM